MKKLAAAAVTALMALAPIAGPAGAVETAGDYNLNDTDNKTAEFTSEPATGTGTGFFLDGTATTYECTGSIDASCDYYLVGITGLTEAEIAAGETSDNVSFSFTIDNYSPLAVADFDLQVFASDADATKGVELGQSGNNPGESESVTTTVKTTAAAPTAYVLVEVVHFATVATTYDAKLRAS